MFTRSLTGDSNFAPHSLAIGPISRRRLKGKDLSDKQGCTSQEERRSVKMGYYSNSLFFVRRFLEHHGHARIAMFCIYRTDNNNYSKSWQFHFHLFFNSNMHIKTPLCLPRFRSPHKSWYAICLSSIATIARDAYRIYKFVIIDAVSDLYTISTNRAQSSPSNNLYANTLKIK